MGNELRSMRIIQSIEITPTDQGFTGFLRFKDGVKAKFQQYSAVRHMIPGTVVGEWLFLPSLDKHIAKLVREDGPRLVREIEDHIQHMNRKPVKLEKGAPVPAQPVQQSIPTTQETFASALHRNRLAQGMTQGGLAMTLDISEQSIIRYEAGNNLPRNGIAPRSCCCSRT
jgi:DNA-binding XRE family transcriptional regulator